MYDESKKWYNQPEYIEYLTNENDFINNYFENELQHKVFHYNTKGYAYSSIFGWYDLDTLLVRRQIRVRYISLKHNMPISSFFDWIKSDHPHFKCTRIERIVIQILKVYARNNKLWKSLRNQTSIFNNI